MTSGKRDCSSSSSKPFFSLKPFLVFGRGVKQIVHWKLYRTHGSLPESMSPLAKMNYDSIFSKKKILPGLQDIWNFGNPIIFSDLKWDEFLEIHEIFYPELIKVFYASLTVVDYVLFNWVNGIDVKMSCTHLANFLHSKFERLDIFSKTLANFENFPIDYSNTFALTLIYNNHTSLIVNENAALFTLICQILAKLSSTTSCLLLMSLTMFDDVLLFLSIASFSII